MLIALLRSNAHELQGIELDKSYHPRARESIINTYQRPVKNTNKTSGSNQDLKHETIQTNALEDRW